MTEPELANATWWAWLWEEIENWAFLGVVVALAIEFAALKFGAPYKKQLEEAKDLKIAELNEETARLRAKEPLVDEALMANALASRASASASQALVAVAEQIALAQGLTTPGKMSAAGRCFQIIPKVKPFAGNKFDASGTSSDPALVALLGSLRASLKVAGWTEVDRSDGGTLVNGDGLVRIHVDASQRAESWEAAQALASALNAEGIEAVATPTLPSGASNVDAIYILIGAKAPSP